MFFSKFVCIIVDGYSTGKNIAPILKAQGYPCIHIKSSTSLPARFKHNQNDFLLSLTYEGNLEAILFQLDEFTIKFCIPGYESGVELADLLSEKINLFSNGSELSSARRNKYIMNETVAQAGIKTVQHFQSENLAELCQWAKAFNHYPVVLKPLSSANGDGVFFCHDEQEIKKGYIHLTATTNQFGMLNKEVLIEELNIGHEYIINTVSWEANHLVAEIWRVTRQANTTVYEKAEIVNVDEEEWQPLADYTFRVLNALHIRYGAGTTEVKYTKKSGATLLETSSRLMGNAPLAFSRELAGFTQLSLLIEAYLNSEDFLARFSRPRLSVKQYGMAVVLMSNCEGIIQNRFSLAFEQLKTLHSYLVEDTVGSKLVKTTDSLTSPGELYLIGSQEDLARDYQLIREWEKTLYHQALLVKPDLSSTFLLFAPQTATAENNNEQIKLTLFANK